MTPKTFLWLVVIWTLASAAIGFALGRLLAAVGERHASLAERRERPSSMPRARW